jgi:hypothetical protein
MPEIEPAVQLNEGFSEPGAAAPPWAGVAQVLSASEMVWLSTVRREGGLTSRRFRRSGRWEDVLLRRLA